MKKIVLVNGPPGSGKDTIAEALAELYETAEVEKFAKPIKETVKFIYGISDKLWDEIDGDQEKKNVGSPLFLGHSCRQVQINISELYMKPTHGKFVFGKLAADRIDRSENQVFCISDSGFPEEAEVMVDRFGAENVVLIRLYRAKCDFSNDSRDYIDLQHRGVPTYDLLNNGTIKEAVDQVVSFIQIKGIV